MLIVSREMYLNTFQNRKLGEISLKKYSNLFPFHTSKLLAGIVADITADGHLGQGLIQFLSKDKRNVLYFQQRMTKIFIIKGKIRTSPSNPEIWECLIGNNALVKLLKFSGVPYGAKVFQKFEVPSWIFGGSKSIKGEYLRRLFDCEGSVILQKTKRVRIYLKMSKSTELQANHEYFLNQLRAMLLEFQIKTTNLTYRNATLRKDGRKTFALEFEIYGTRKNLVSILNFQKYIGFDDKGKKEKLNKSIMQLLHS